MLYSGQHSTDRSAERRWDEIVVNSPTDRLNGILRYDTRNSFSPAVYFLVRPKLVCRESQCRLVSELAAKAAYALQQFHLFSALRALTSTETLCRVTPIPPHATVSWRSRIPTTIPSLRHTT